MNASPFIVLALGGWVELLHVAGERIFMPRTVEREVLRAGASDAAVLAIRRLTWIDVVDVGEPLEELRRFQLDAGEEAVLTWAMARPGSVAIMDDRRGRRAAQMLGIPVLGTLGVILEAKRQAVIPAARPIVEQLVRRTRWHVSPTLIDAFLAQAGE